LAHKLTDNAVAYCLWPETRTLPDGRTDA